MAMCQGGLLVLLVLLVMLVLLVLLILLVLLVLGPFAYFLWASSFAIANPNRQNLQDQKTPIGGGREQGLFPGIPNLDPLPFPTGPDFLAIDSQLCMYNCMYNWRFFFLAACRLGLMSLRLI